MGIVQSNYSIDARGGLCYHSRRFGIWRPETLWDGSDLRNISQKDLIWITEEVDLILAIRDFTREELDRLAKAVSVECVNWDYEDVSPKGVE